MTNLFIQLYRFIWPNQSKFRRQGLAADLSSTAELLGLRLVSQAIWTYAWRGQVAMPMVTRVMGSGLSLMRLAFVVTSGHIIL